MKQSADYDFDRSKNRALVSRIVASSLMYICRLGSKIISGNGISGWDVGM